jgi:hypothetical protein
MPNFSPAVTSLILQSCSWDFMLKFDHFSVGSVFYRGKVVVAAEALQITSVRKSPLGQQGIGLSESVRPANTLPLLLAQCAQGLHRFRSTPI